MNGEIWLGPGNEPLQGSGEISSFMFSKNSLRIQMSAVWLEPGMSPCLSIRWGNADSLLSVSFRQWDVCFSTWGSDSHLQGMGNSSLLSPGSSDLVRRGLLHHSEALASTMSIM